MTPSENPADPSETPADMPDLSHPFPSVRDGDVPIDDEVLAEMNLISDSETPGLTKTKRNVGGAILAASMFGLAEVIEPSNMEAGMEQVVENDNPDDDPLAGLDFGDLPPLN